MRVCFGVMFLFAAFVLPTAHAGERTPGESLFHPPQTEAEKVLDKLFDLEDKDSNMYFFALGRPNYDPAQDTGYAQLFTKALLTAWRKKEAELVQEACDGKYREGEICGFDYNVIVCAQDRPGRYVFRTIKSGKESAIIVTTWPEYVKREETFTVYRLVKERGVWKLDGVDCSRGDIFNMPTVW